MASSLVKGDGGSKVHATITDAETDLPLDLTGKTVDIAFTIAAGTLVTVATTILNQTTSKGQVEYQFSVANLSVSGELEAEFIINRNLSDRLTTEKFRVKVRDPKT